MEYDSFGSRRRRRLPSPPCRCRCSRGFRFRLRGGKRFSVQSLRTRFMSLFTVLAWLKHRYGQALRLLRFRGGSKKVSSSRERLVQGGVPCSSSTTKTCGSWYVARSNTFHAEAIADCLEFIKGTYSTTSVVGHGDDDDDDDQRLRQSAEDDSAKR